MLREVSNPRALTWLLLVWGVQGEGRLHSKFHFPENCVNSWRRIPPEIKIAHSRVIENSCHSDLRITAFRAFLLKKHGTLAIKLFSFSRKCEHSRRRIPPVSRVIENSTCHSGRTTAGFRAVLPKKHGTLAVKFFRPILTAPRSQDRGGWGDRILEQICEILEIRCKIPRQGAPFSPTSPIFKICSFEPIEKYARTTKPWYPLPAIAYQDAS